jgi:hypothetical protein
MSLVEANKNTKVVHANLVLRLERLEAEGVVDLKVTCGRSSSVNDKLWVLNNVLRLQEEGRMTVDVLEGERK